jgi:hypothetical protein
LRGCRILFFWKAFFDLLEIWGNSTFLNKLLIFILFRSFFII